MSYRILPCFLRLLFEYAGALEGEFLPHVPVAVSALLPAITFRFNEEVRSSAALALAKVFCSALNADISVATQLLEACLSVLLEGLEGESQDEVGRIFGTVCRFEYIYTSGFEHKGIFTNAFLISSLVNFNLVTVLEVFLHR